MVEVVKEALNGNYEKAKKIHYKLLNLMEANFIESNPIPVKYVMKKLGFCDGSMRLPMTELSKKDVMDKVLKEYL
jgi:4-hydroxy-tetrahydrodipicolinate synthase